MKRKTLLLAVLMIVFALSLCFAGCGCSHSNLVRHKATAATCDKSGNVEYWQCSNCNKCFADSRAQREISGTTIAAKGHRWGQWKATTPATCTQSGVEARSCSTCRKTETRAIPNLHHKEVLLAGIVPNCTETGLTEGKKCSVCGKILVEQQIRAALGHDWRWVVDLEPTQTEPGFQHEECTRCDETRNENTPIEPTMHVHAMTKVAATQPTCAQSGNVEHWQCLTCGKLYSDKNGENEISPNSVVIAATEHVQVVTLGTDPTCTRTGLTEGTECSVCGMILTEQLPIAAKGHHFEVSQIEPSTCNEFGFAEVTCTVCGASHTWPLMPSDHVYDDNNVCVVCGDVWTTPPSHTHSFTESVVAPTCTESGYTLLTCSCGMTRRANIVEPLGHAFDDGVVTTAASCNFEGEKTHSCTRCSAYFVEIVPASHDWQTNVVKPATCAQEGEAQRNCSVCGLQQTVAIAPSHAFGAEVVYTKATCNTPGHAERICNDCGVHEVIEVPATGHSYVNGVCIHCGEYFADNVITNPDAHVLYGMYFKVDETVSAYGPLTVDEYGVYLYVNEGAQIDKVAVYLTQQGNMWCRTIACTGTNITEAIFVPYLSYGAEIRYSGFSSDCINTFALSPNSDGVWSVSNYTLIAANLADSHGDMILSVYDIAEASAATRIFDNLEEMKAWLGSVAHTHTLVKTAAKEATCLTAGNKEYWQCSDCGRYFGDQQGKAEITLNSTVVAAKGHVDADKNCMCDVCNTQLEHKEEILAAVKPTCTRVGLTAGKKCSVCGKILVAQKELPLVNHKFADGTEITEEDLAMPHALDKNDNPLGMVLISGTTYVCDFVPTADAHRNGGVVCPVCEQFIPLYITVPHTFDYKLTAVGTDNCTLRGTCKVCGKVDGPMAVKEVTHREEPSTCVVQGTRTYLVTTFDGTVYNVAEKLPLVLHRDSNGKEYDPSQYTAETPYKWTKGEETNGVLIVKSGEVPACGKVFEVGFVCDMCGKFVDFYATMQHTAPEGFAGSSEVCTQAEVEANTYKCTNCGESMVPEVVGHNFADGVCTRCGAKEAETPVGPEGLVYTLSSNGTSYSVTGIGTCNVADIVIPSTYNGKPVTGIGNNAFKDCASVTSITIPNSVTKIGDGAFAGCSGLTAIDIANGVKEIGMNAFYSCSSLTNIVIPDSVTNIGSFAFSSCSNLTSITLSKNVTYVAQKAFYYCKNLTSITIPDKVKTISDNAFEGCRRLESVTFGNNSKLTTIDSRAFLDCSGLKNITIPDSVTTIAGYAFESCSGLTSVTFGDNSKLTAIDYGTFRHCSSLTSINIPKSVTTIHSWAFQDCSSLTSIIIPESVTKIDAEAFRGCSQLEINCEAESKPSGWNSNWNSSDCPVNWGYTAPPEGLAFIMNSDGASYYVTGTGACDIEEVIIPATYNGKPVTAIGDYTFAYWYTLKCVTIPNSVTAIGSDAFQGCNNLTNVTIPDSVTEISDNAFQGCESLTSITIPNSVMSLGYNVFGDCHALSSVTIYANVYGISSNMFENCTNLKSVTFGENTSPYIIGSNAFGNCTSLSSINIPNSVMEIYERAFEGCTGLRSINIPDGVISIGDNAFENCASLESITIPGNARVGAYVFANAGLTSVTIKEGFTSIFAQMFASCTKLTSVNLPNSVATIDNNAFDGCSSLTDINIPEGVTLIGNSAFAGCSSLTDINIPEGVRYLGDYAFCNCSSLTSITIPINVDAVGFNAFYGCTNLTINCEAANQPWNWNLEWNPGNRPVNWGYTEAPAGSVGLEYTLDSNEEKYLVTGIGTCTDTDVVIPATYNDKPVTAIGERAFEYCTSFTSITIPDSVYSIGESAFSCCTSLTSITIPNSVTSINSFAFGNCSSLTSITIPDSVTRIYNSVFNGCSGLESIVVASGNSVFRSEDNCLIANATNTLIRGCKNSIIPNNITAIADCAFSGCSGLTSISIPDIVTSIGANAFESCTELTSITIPYGVTSIGGYMFFNCTSLTSITIPDSVTSIGNEAFCKCSSLTNITIPDSVTSIGKRAFHECTGLISINIPENVTSIGENAFGNCQSLTSISIPQGVTSISKFTFSSCQSLTSVTISNGVASIGVGAFYGCTKLTDITIPDSVTSIDRNAFDNCTNLTINCEAASQPSGWASNWNPDNRPVNWGYNA